MILKHLVQSEEFTRTTIPFLKKSYFTDLNKVAFESVIRYVSKYNAMPTKDAFGITLAEDSRVDESNAGRALKLAQYMYEETALHDHRWILDKTEEWCQEQAITKAIFDSIDIIKGQNEKLAKGAIPGLLQEALGVSFDRSIGHDYFEDAEARYEFYHRIEEKIKLDLDVLNEITGGGLTKKTLNVLMAPTGVGKSLIMCHLAASALAAGHNVVYITLEMSEEKISERIDANLLGTDISALVDMSKVTFLDKIGKLHKKSAGKLIVKEYPTASANANHFRALLDEIRLKKNMEPDIVFIDYLNIASSSRKISGVSMYELVKSIAEEIRGLAQEFNVPIITATQTNRDGWNNSDIDLDNTSESFGLPATADLMLGVMQTEDMAKQGHYLFKQLKNRYEDRNKKLRFAVGVDKARMRLYDMELDDTDLAVMDSGQVADASDQYKEFKF